MNDYWEDMNMSEKLKEFHGKSIEEMNVPSWALINCPYCQKKLSYISLRSIGLCFNARNLGDITVEFCCEDCKKMDTVYFRREGKDMDTFIKELKGDIDSLMLPIIEGEMYKMQYNNLVEKMGSP